MPDNRYNVDDILRELNQKSAAPTQRTPVDYEQSQQPQRRPTTGAGDSWEPVESRRPQPPQQRPNPSGTPPPQRPNTGVSPAQQRPNSGVSPAQQRPNSAVTAPQQRRPNPGVTPAPQRPNSAVTAPQPRLGQQPQRPKTREEMDRLLGNFSESDDPFGDLGFLQSSPEPDGYSDTQSPASNFTPDWDRPQPPPQRPNTGVSPAPQRPNTGVSPAPQRPNPAAMPVQQRPNPAAMPVQQRPNTGVAPVPPRRSMMQSRDRRSMADAARMITGGGMADFPEPESQQQTPPRSRPPMRSQPLQQRGGSDALSQQRPLAMGSVPPAQERMGRLNQLDKLDQLDQLDRQPMPPATRRPPMEPTRQRQAIRPAPPAAAHTETPEQEEAAEPRKTARSSPSMQQVSDQLDRMRAGLLVRALVNVLTLGAVIYLVLANSYGLPLPGFLSGGENVGMLLWCSVLLVALSTLASGNAVGGGILALCKLRPSNDSYTALAVFACLIQGAYMAMQPALMTTHGETLYLPMAVLMLTFNTLGKLIMMARMTGSFAILAAKGPKQVAGIMDNREFAKRLSAEIIGDEPCLVYAAQAATVSGFLDQAFSESKAEDISKIIAPMSALAALVMALVSYLFNTDIFTSACVFTAALCITAPLAGVIASALPLYITNGKLTRWGASLCGYDAVNQFATANGVVLRAAQLLPKGSVSLLDIQVLDRRPIDQVLVDAASVLCGCDSYLAPVFHEMVQDASMLYQPENIEFVDSMGVSAWVNGRRVLIGNRNLMASYGVPVPDMDYERQYTAGGGEALYIANSGEASGMLLLGYKPDKSMRRSLELICDSDMGICVYSNDPTLTIAKLSALYHFPQELLTIIPATMQQGTERYLHPTQTAEACVVHNGSPAAYLRTILAARSCSRCITLQTALLLMSVVIGFAIVTFFAFTQNMGALTWVTLTVFQFFWLLLELVVPLFKH